MCLLAISSTQRFCTYNLHGNRVSAAAIFASRFHLAPALRSTHKVRTVLSRPKRFLNPSSGRHLEGWLPGLRFLLHPCKYTRTYQIPRNRYVVTIIIMRMILDYTNIFVICNRYFWLSKKYRSAADDLSNTVTLSQGWK